MIYFGPQRYLDEIDSAVDARITTPLATGNGWGKAMPLDQLCEPAHRVKEYSLSGELEIKTIGFDGGATSDLPHYKDNITFDSYLFGSEDLHEQVIESEEGLSRFYAVRSRSSTQIITDKITTVRSVWLPAHDEEPARVEEDDIPQHNIDQTNVVFSSRTTLSHDVDTPHLCNTDLFLEFNGPGLGDGGRYAKVRLGALLEEGAEADAYLEVDMGPLWPQHKYRMELIPQSNPDWPVGVGVTGHLLLSAHQFWSWGARYDTATGAEL